MEENKNNLHEFLAISVFLVMLKLVLKFFKVILIKYLRY